MRGGDLINTLLPDEILHQVFRWLLGHKSARDAASLVCKRWLCFERASRGTVRIDSRNVFISSVLCCFHILRNVFIDGRLTVSCSAPYTRNVLGRNRGVWRATSSSFVNHFRLGGSGFEETGGGGGGGNFEPFR